jgi:hypothetical protein
VPLPWFQTVGQIQSGDQKASDDRRGPPCLGTDHGLNPAGNADTARQDHKTETIEEPEDDHSLLTSLG